MTPPTGARRSHSSPGPSPTSGTLGSRPASLRPRSSPPGSPCGARSSGQRIVWRFPAEIITGSTSPAGMRCARGHWGIGTMTARRARSGQFRRATMPGMDMGRRSPSNVWLGRCGITTRPSSTSRFADSGTSLIAAEQLHRRCLALEIEPRYVQVAIDRWEAFTGATATKVGAVMHA